MSELRETLISSFGKTPLIFLVTPNLFTKGIDFKKMARKNEKTHNKRKRRQPKNSWRQDTEAHLKETGIS